MRIVYLSPSAELGGAERCLLDLIASVREADRTCEVKLLVPAEGPLVERARTLAAEAVVLPMPPTLRRFGDSSLERGGGVTLPATAAAAALGGARYTLALRRRLAALSPDVLHSNGMKFHLLSALAYGSRAPVLWHVRDFVGSRRLMAPALRLAAVRAGGVIAISRAVAEDVGIHLPGVPAEVVYDAIDVGEFSPGPRAADGVCLDRLANVPIAPPGTVRIGLVATYARWKGQDLFLEAAARVASAHPSARFFVAGGPIYATHGSQFSRGELEEHAARLGLAGRIGFVPFQEDPAWLYRSLDVVVHASTHPEPFGRTIAEAMSCGRPVVAASDAGAAELLKSGEDALLYRRGDVADLAEAMLLLAARPALRTRLGAAARATASASFSRSRLGAAMLAVYARAVGGKAHERSRGVSWLDHRAE